MGSAGAPNSAHRRLAITVRRHCGVASGQFRKNKLMLNWLTGSVSHFSRLSDYYQLLLRYHWLMRVAEPVSGGDPE